MVRRFLISACIIAASLGTAVANETISLMLDRATVIKAPDRKSVV